MKQQLKFEDKTVTLTNLEKTFWTHPKITKLDLIQYYIAIAPYALKHLAQRPLTVTRYPSGVFNKGFYQKNCPSYAPDWIKTFNISLDQKTQTNYILSNDLATLVWLANQGVIEIHPANYQTHAVDQPSYAIIDLDPTAPTGFAETRQIALKTQLILQELGLEGFPKTSGATGIHIYIPLAGGYSFSQSTDLVRFIGETLVKLYPNQVTNQRLVKNRSGIYVDHLQNLQNKTIVGVYSLRPLVGAPVSTPISWEELKTCNPSEFNLFTLPKRLKKEGDLFAPILTNRQSIEHLLPFI